MHTSVSLLEDLVDRIWRGEQLSLGGIDLLLYLNNQRSYRLLDTFN